MTRLARRREEKKKHSPTGPSLCFDERLPFTLFSTLLFPALFLPDAIFAPSVYAPPLASPPLHTCRGGPRSRPRRKWGANERRRRGPLSQSRHSGKIDTRPPRRLGCTTRQRSESWSIQYRLEGHYVSQTTHRGICRILFTQLYSLSTHRNGRKQIHCHASKSHSAKCKIFLIKILKKNKQKKTLKKLITKQPHHHGPLKSCSKT